MLDIFVQLFSSTATTPRLLFPQLFFSSIKREIDYLINIILKNYMVLHYSSHFYMKTDT